MSEINIQSIRNQLLDAISTIDAQIAKESKTVCPILCGCGNKPELRSFNNRENKELRHLQYFCPKCRAYAPSMYGIDATIWAWNKFQATYILEINVGDIWSDDDEMFLITKKHNNDKFDVVRNNEGTYNYMSIKAVRLISRNGSFVAGLRAFTELLEKEQ